MVTTFVNPDKIMVTTFVSLVVKSAHQLKGSDNILETLLLLSDIQFGRTVPSSLQVYPVMPEPTPRNTNVAQVPSTPISPTSSTVHTSV